MDEVIERFTLQSKCFATMLYNHRPDNDGMNYDPEILRLRADTDSAIADPVQFAFDGFCWAAQLRHSCAPECNGTFAAAGRSFPRCAGCGILCYCSRECQRSAWRHVKAPHKDVCPKLRVLHERTNLPQKEVKDRLRQPFIDVCKLDEGLRALADDCARYLHYLMTARQDVRIAQFPSDAPRALLADVWRCSDDLK